MNSTRQRSAWELESRAIEHLKGRAQALEVPDTSPESLRFEALEERRTDVIELLPDTLTPTRDPAPRSIPQTYVGLELRPMRSNMTAQLQRVAIDQDHFCGNVEIGGGHARRRQQESPWGSPVTAAAGAIESMEARTAGINRAHHGRKSLDMRPLLVNCVKLGRSVRRVRGRL